jgi:hypothetical protein
MGDVDRPTHWWNTIPGIVTAVAAVITAGAGLLAALDHAGYIPHHAEDQPPPPAPPASIAVKVAGCEETLQDQISYALDIKRDPDINCHVTLINNGRTPLNLKDLSWRLVVDDVPKPPSAPVDLVVQPETAGQADFTFVVPPSFSGGILRVRAGDSVAEAKVGPPAPAPAPATRPTG